MAMLRVFFLETKGIFNIHTTLIEKNSSSSYLK